MIGELEMYAFTAAVMALVAVPFAVLVARLPAERRRYYLPVVVLPLVNVATFGVMSQGVLLFEGPDGSTIPLARLVAYAVIYPTTTVYIGLAGGVSRSGVAKMAGLVLVVVVGVGVNWAVPDPFGSLGGLAMIAGLTVLAYLLLGPYARVAAGRSGERTLLFGKLRNLLLLLWASYVAVGLTSRQALGLLDTFAGVFMGNYIDLLGVVGFGIIVLGSRAGVEEAVDAEGGLLERDPAGDDGEPAAAGTPTDDEPADGWTVGEDETVVDGSPAGE